MKYKTLAIATLLSFSCYFSVAQSFQSIYFPFDNFSFIDGMNHGDFNGDSLPDFLITASNFGIMQLGINNGLDSPEFEEIGDINSIDHTAIIDIDEDGDLDIIGRTMWDGVHLFINDGNANFERQDFDLPYYRTINFSDITGDGSEEMIVGTFELSIYKIDKTSFELTLLYSGDFGDGDIGAVNSFDFDNDGDLDVVVSIETSGLVCFKQTAPLTFEPELLYDDTYDADLVEVVNINNDNIYDFVLYSYDDKQGKIVLSDGTSQYLDVNVNPGNSMNTLTLVGDLNADDKQEIIVFENTDFNNFSMSIKEYKENNLTDLLVVDNHYASFGGGVTDIDNDGDMDFYFFQNDAIKPGLVYYLSDGLLTNSDRVEIATDVDIYPNPANGLINIDVKGNQNFQVNLYDLEGRIITTTSNTAQLNLDSNLKGVYLLEIIDTNTYQKIVKKVIIEN